jgi:hypothetical protein
MLFSDEPLLALGATCPLSSTRDFEVVGGHISLSELPAVREVVSEARSQRQGI